MRLQCNYQLTGYEEGGDYLNGGLWLRVQGVLKIAPMVFCQNLYDQWHFFRQILRTKFVKCKICLKKMPSVIEILAKIHRGSFFETPCSCVATGQSLTAGSGCSLGCMLAMSVMTVPPRQRMHIFI